MRSIPDRAAKGRDRSQPPDETARRTQRIHPSADRLSIRVHDLRHTAASFAISCGANIKVVQRMLGHRHASMTLDRYGHLYTEDLEEVANRLDAVFIGDAQNRIGPGMDQAKSQVVRPSLSNSLTWEFSSGSRGNRTHNLRVKSPLLCQLS